MSAATSSTYAGWEQIGTLGVPDPAMTALVNSVGDDIFAATDMTALLDPMGTNGTQHYGPYPTAGSLTGSCGNQWANATADRFFTVHRDPTTGSFTVVEQFKGGDFVTNLGASPAGCDSSYSDHGSTVNQGVTGSGHGYFIIPNVMQQTSTSPDCNAVSMTNAGCNTATFINTHFTPCYPGTCMLTTFFLHYAAGDQGLIFHDYTNASRDRGGNRGDIANA